MRRIKFKVLVALLTFVVGILTYAFWRMPTSSIRHTSPLNVSLCQLQNDPEFHDRKVIYLKAVMYKVDGQPYLYDLINCAGENIASPLVDQRGFDGLNSGMEDWLKNKREVTAVSDVSKETDVAIVGIFDKNYGEPEDWLRFRIIPIKI